MSNNYINLNNMIIRNIYYKNTIEIEFFIALYILLVKLHIFFTLNVL